MVRDDDVDAAIDRAPHRVHAGDSAVNGDHEAHGLLSQNALQHFEFQAVAVDQTMRNDVRCVGAEEAEDGLKEDDGGDAVDIVIAVDQDRFFVSNGALDPLACCRNSVNARGIVQISDRRSNEAAVLIFSSDAAAVKNLGDDRMDRKIAVA